MSFDGVLMAWSLCRLRSFPSPCKPKHSGQCFAILFGVPGQRSDAPSRGLGRTAIPARGPRASLRSDRPPPRCFTPPCHSSSLSTPRSAWSGGAREDYLQTCHHGTRHPPCPRASPTSGLNSPSGQQSISSGLRRRFLIVGSLRNSIHHQANRTATSSTASATSKTMFFRTASMPVLSAAQRHHRIRGIVM